MPQRLWKSRWLIFALTILSGFGVLSVLPADSGEDAATDELSLLTEADRIAGLRTTLAQDNARLQSYQQISAELNEDFDRQSNDFSRLDSALQQYKSSGPTAKTQQRIEQLSQQRTEMKSAFDLTIEYRKAVGDQIKTLRSKTELLRSTLDQLIDVDSGEVATQIAGNSDEYQAADQHLGGGSQPGDGNSQTSAVLAEPPAGGMAGSVPTGAIPGDAEAQLAAPAVNVGGSVASVRTVPRVDEWVEEAQRELNNAIELQHAAEENLENLQAALEFFEKDRLGERGLLELAQAQPHFHTVTGFRFTDIESIDRHRQRVAELGRQVALLSKAKESSLAAVKSTTAKAESAARWLRFMQSSFAPHKMLEWLLTVSPRIVALLTLFVVGWWSLRFIGRRVVQGLVSRTHAGTDADREEQANTLIGVFNSMISLAVLVVGTMTVLDQAGIDVTVLLGGAAVFGMAIAFGAEFDPRLFLRKHDSGRESVSCRQRRSNRRDCRFGSKHHSANDDAT